MYCKINPRIALRSFWLVPHAYYIEGRRCAGKLEADEFALLEKCDGVTDLEDSELLQSLISRNYALPVEKGDVPDEWSRAKYCDNRYFMAAHLSITGKCNYNCLHCFNASDNAPLMSELSYEDCVRVLDECVCCGIQSITITGGEPFVHKDFMRILEACSKRHLSLYDINTNGSLINEKNLQQIKDLGLNPRMKISFDCFGHHDWMRNVKNAETKTLEAIQLCHDMGFCVKVQTNVHRGNLDTLFRTADYFDKHGIEQMRIIRTTEAPRWNENANGKCLDIEEYYREMLKFAADYIKDSTRKMEIDIWQFLTVFAAYKKYKYRPVALSGTRYRDWFPVCCGNRGMISITSSGEVVPCTQMSGYFEKNNRSLGNIHDMPLQSFLQKGPYLDNVTCPISSVREHNPACQSCKYWRLCAGGCRAIALALSKDGDLLDIDPSKCLFFKHGWMDKIRGSLETANSDYKNMDTLDGIPISEYEL